MVAGMVFFFFFSFLGERMCVSRASHHHLFFSPYLRRHRQQLGPCSHDLADVQRRRLLALHDDLGEVVYLVMVWVQFFLEESGKK